MTSRCSRCGRPARLPARCHPGIPLPRGHGRMRHGYPWVRRRPPAGTGWRSRGPEPRTPGSVHSGWIWKPRTTPSKGARSGSRQLCQSWLRVPSPVYSDARFPFGPPSRRTTTQSAASASGTWSSISVRLWEVSPVGADCQVNITSCRVDFTVKRGKVAPAHRRGRVGRRICLSLRDRIVRCLVLVVGGGGPATRSKPPARRSRSSGNASRNIPSICAYRASSSRSFVRRVM